MRHDGNKDMREKSNCAIQWNNRVPWMKPTSRLQKKIETALRTKLLHGCSFKTSVIFAGYLNM